MDAISWYALGRTVNDPTTIMEEIDDKILTHNLDASAHGQSNEAVYNHRIAELLDHVSYSIYNVKVNPAARIYKAIVGPGFEADFSTIQAAVDWANLYGGGIVHIKAGTYHMTSDLHLYSNILLQGEDMDLTILDFDDLEYNVHAIGTSGSHKRNIEIRNLQIRQSSFYELGCIRLEYCDDCEINRVKITDCKTGGDPVFTSIFLNNCKRIRITENHLIDNIRGIYIEDSSQTFIEFNYFNLIEKMVLFFGTSPTTIFRHNYLDTNGDATYDSMIYMGSDCDNSVFDSNFFMNCRTSTFWTEDGSRISFTNNVFTSSGTGPCAVILNNSDRCIVANNRIYGMEDSGVILDNSCVRNIVNSNVITNCGGWGVEIREATDLDNAVIGNVVYGNASGGVLDSGTGDDVAHNVT
jgi:parallel beta-helix repeat protein